MKKIILAALAGVIVFTFACCSKKEEGPVYAYRDAEGNVVTGVAEELEEEIGHEKDRSEIVEIELPLPLIDEKYQKDLDKYAEDYGYKQAKLDKKTQMVKIKMTAMSYDLLLTRIGVTVMKSIGSTFESEEFPYMLGIGEYNDDFSEIEIFVDKAKYKEDPQSSLLPYAIGEYCMYYQLYTTRKECECKVTVKDNKTKTVITTEEYKQESFSTQS